MGNKLIKIVRNFFNICGLDLQRYSAASNPSAQIMAALRQVEADVVFDIGANVGQFSKELFDNGFKGKIVSFEPLSSAYEKLIIQSRSYSSWHVHQRTAVGDQDSEIIINIAGNSVSSSVLPMLNAHSSAAKNSAYVASEKVPVTRLDSIAKKYIEDSSKIFIKIDTQGFEWQVLEGASNTLNHACGVLLELSLVPLYEGQHLWLEIIERMRGLGFTLWVIQKGFTDPNTGRSLQIDAIFLRI